MEKFFNIIVKLIIISIVQSITESFFDDKKIYMKKLISILCTGVSFYIVLNYIYFYIFKEILYIIKNLL